MGKVTAIPKKIAIGLVRIYRYAISPFFAPSCRFTPTCSEYAIESMQKHGFIRGSFLAIKRIFKCHPFHKGGYDPVPDDLKISKVNN